MLTSLHIRNYVLIDSLDVDFPEGLVVISGATGAGKSILLGALGLLCGAKADAGAISAGADSCVVEGTFDFDDEGLRKVCEENDLDYDGGHLLIRRVVSSSGRSRCFVNDCPVALPLLGSISSLLLDIHSQHDTLLLTDRRYQLSVLDAYARNAELLRRTESSWTALRRLDEEITSQQAAIARAREENDYNSALYSQLVKADVHEGELQSLQEEQYALAHSGQIKELLEACDALFNSEDSAAVPVNAALVRIGKNLRKLSEYMPQMGPLADRLESSRLELKDISEQVVETDEALACDPSRLQQVDDRIGLITDLLKRHGCEDEAGLLRRRDSLKELVVGLDGKAERLEDMKKEREVLAASLDGLFKELHSRRKEAAGRFAKAVLENLRQMELDGARFEVELSTAPASASGTDAVSFLFSATGSAPVPVAKCASGGELSRIMLSLKQFMSSFMKMPTIIFDEIDTGVSGSVADRMGSVICNMGNDAQVFAITHLPQVAAKGKAHYLVEKTVNDGRGSSSIRKLTGDDRVMEIARMLSGETTSPQAVANAKSLLGLI